MRKNEYKDMTVSELFIYWIEEKKKTVSENTCNVYWFYYDRFMSEQFGSIKVNELFRRDWMKFERAMLAGKDANGQEISVSTASHAITVFHSIFGFGRTKFRLNNPTESLRVSSKNIYTANTFTIDEVKKLRSAVKPFDIYHLCIMMCLYNGADVSEICGAQWGDIDIKKKRFKVRRVISTVPNPENRSILYIETVPKQKKALRDLPIPKWINEQLEALKPMHSDEEYLLADEFRESTPPNFRHHFNRFLEEAGVEPNTVKALRDTFAITCIKKGMDIKTLSELLGHANTSTTVRMYYGKTKTNAPKIIEKLYD
ncbi:Site-specific recombinase XerD [Ruminococcaceae bacterium FB2012]|nr:Site-specific recombinase XerD [Ruminococcaceae bacterium FB2012]